MGGELLPRREVLLTVLFQEEFVVSPKFCIKHGFAMAPYTVMKMACVEQEVIFK